jgi:folate-dependent phosphoribosylglycinamide formyltransferase PurN
MIIHRRQISSKNNYINEIRTKIANINKIYDINDIKNIDFEYLTNSNLNWDKIKILLKEDYKKFEKILFQIHLKRRYQLSKLERYNILKFLAIAYQYSRDVRYFNEFLWFFRKHEDWNSLWLLTMDNFFKNLNEQNNHHFPLCEIQEIENFINKSIKIIETFVVSNYDHSMRIGLMGSPTFFPKIREHLLSSGFYVRCYFIPYHPNKMVNFLFRNKVAFKLYCILKNVKFDYKTVDYNIRDPKIKEILLKDKLDIGFHKLGFIIRSNIISPFKIGLINDHWGILPFIRGRSTIEYSILFGIPVVATTHLVDEGIDTGNIINIYIYRDIIKKYSKIKYIRKFIRNNMHYRAIDSIKILSKTKNAIINNVKEKGLTFYSIHPALVSFIENNILK